MMRLMRRGMMTPPKTPWYLAGDISPSNVLGAWCPKNAASYASSKISLVNPSASNLLVDGAAFPSWALGTGWTFAVASSQYLTIASSIATSTPISMVVRFWATNITANYELMGITNGNVDYWKLQISGGVAGDPVRATLAHTTAAAAASSTGYTAGVWYTAAAVYSSATLRTAYINGGSAGTNATSIAPSGTSATYVGACPINGSNGFMDGKIAACAFYNIASSAAQVLALHNAMMLL